MEAAALLAEALLDAVLQEGRQLQMLLADAVALVVLLLACKVLIAAIHLQWMLLFSEMRPPSSLQNRFYSAPADAHSGHSTVRCISEVEAMTCCCCRAWGGENWKQISSPPGIAWAASSLHSQLPQMCPGQWELLQRTHLLWDHSCLQPARIQNPQTKELDRIWADCRFEQSAREFYKLTYIIAYTKQLGTSIDLCQEAHLLST